MEIIQITTADHPMVCPLCEGDIHLHVKTEQCESIEQVTETRCQCGLQEEKS